jgi:hypothetical protein
VVSSEGYPLNAGKFYVAAKAGPRLSAALRFGAWFVWPVIGKGCGRLTRRVLSPMLEHDLRANAVRVCREGKPLRTFPDHAVL